MKKSFFMTLLLICLMCMGISAAAQTVSLDDGAGLLDSSETGTVSNLVRDVAQATGWNIMAVSTNDTGGRSARSYAEDYFLAHTEGDDGVVCLIDMDNREIYMATSGAATRYLTDERIDNILDEAYADISNGRYAATFSAMLQGVKRSYQQGSGQYTYNETTGQTTYYEEPKSVSPLEGLIAGIAALFSGSGLFAAVRGRYKAKSGSYRYDFRQQGNFLVSGKEDQLVNRFVTHRKIVRANTNSGGGGHGGGGTTVHTGSGGHTFGGGGRKF